MKIYVAVESGNLGEDEETRVLGATKYKNDAIKYAAERNDNNRLNFEDRTCQVMEFESEDINTESKTMPKILYSFVFDASGKLLLISNWSYTYNEYYSVNFLKASKCYIMSLTLDCNIPENAAKEIAQDKMNEYIKENGIENKE